MMSNWCTSDFTVQAFSGLFTETVFTQRWAWREMKSIKKWTKEGLNGTFCLSQLQLSLQLSKLCYSSSFLMEETSILHLSQREPSHSTKKWNTATAVYISGTHQNIPVSDDAEDAFSFLSQPSLLLFSLLYFQMSENCSRTLVSKDLLLTSRIKEGEGMNGCSWSHWQNILGCRKKLSPHPFTTLKSVITAGQQWKHAHFPDEQDAGYDSITCFPNIAGSATVVYMICVSMSQSKERNTLWISTSIMQ